MNIVNDFGLVKEPRSQAIRATLESEAPNLIGLNTDALRSGFSIPRMTVARSARKIKHGGIEVATNFGHVGNNFRSSKDRTTIEISTVDRLPSFQSRGRKFVLISSLILENFGIASCSKP